MVGLIIGTAAVVSAFIAGVSLGESVKKDVAEELFQIEKEFANLKGEAQSVLTSVLIRVRNLL